MANGYERDDWFGCWLWTGTINSSGYATHWGPTGPRPAHVVYYERQHGPVEPGKDLDHLCRRRHCVADAHLELVTKAENMRRKRWGHRAQRERCRAGHDLFTNGRRTPEGGLVCRVCSGVIGAK